jgi:hypothetical protein
MVSSVEAKHRKNSPNRIGFNYSYQNSVYFEERGVEFFIFTNGEFDFNTSLNNNYRGNLINREREIYRNYKGQITRIGNSFIRYDRYGNVIRIGNVFMRYYRGKLTSVGHLKVRYDYWGNHTFYGNVKNNYYHYNGLRINLNIGDICSYNDAYFYGNDFRTNYSRIREDNNYYYYRANPNAKIGKRSKTLRRRKPTLVSLKNIPTRNVNNSYRKTSNVNMVRNVTPTSTIIRKIRKNTSSYKPHNAITIRRVKPVRRNTSSTNKRSNTVQRKVITQPGRK